MLLRSCGKCGASFLKATGPQGLEGDFRIMLQCCALAAVMLESPEVICYSPNPDVSCDPGHKSRCKKLFVQDRLRIMELEQQKRLTMLEQQKLNVLMQALSSSENVSTETSRAAAKVAETATRTTEAASKAVVGASRVAQSVCVSKQVVEAVNMMNGPATVLSTSCRDYVETTAILVTVLT